jgi:uncharacterized protein YycO
MPARDAVKLQFVQGRALSSRAISWFSSGHFSHVDIVLPDGKLLGARSDAAGGVKGVAIRNAAYEKWNKVVIFNVFGTPKQVKTAYDIALAQVGKPYDHTAILGFMMNRAWMDSDAWYCSELVMAALQQAGIIGELYLAANKITPVAAALAISAHRGTSWQDVA